jgi:archaellin
MNKKCFLSDVTDDYLSSLAQGQWLIFGTTPDITLNRRKETVIENGQAVEIDFMVNVLTDKSNNITQNGIIHSIDKPLTIYEPSAVAVTLKFAGDPADRGFSYQGVSYNITSETIFDDFNNDEERQSAIWWLKWEGLMTGIFTSEWPANTFGDYTVYVTSNTGEYSIELTTKPIFKGRYRLYVTYRRGAYAAGSCFAYFYWDDELIGERWDMAVNRDAFGTTINSGTDRRIDRGVGYLNLTEMGVHKFKLNLPNPNGTYNVWYSIEFVPY